MSIIVDDVKAKKNLEKKLFSEFTQEMRDKGLLDKTPIRGAFEILLELTGYVLVYMFMTQISPIVVGLVFVLLMVRSTYIVHDLLHKQYFSYSFSKKLGLIFGNLTLGLSGKWWNKEHNVMHHTYTNSAERDGDVQGFGGAFLGKHDSVKLLHRFQHLVFYAFLPLIYIGFVMQTYKFVFKNKEWTELLFLVLHLAFPISFFMILPTSDAIIVTLVMYIGYGFALSMVTITNHIGLPILFGDEYKKHSWLSLQTQGSRNVRGGLFTHYIYGGLNTQVEHHIFPHASRFNLLKVAKHTKAFCEKHDLIYYETSPWQAYKEIYVYLKDLRYKG